MSMLSEQRRKTKWIINPTKKPIWSSDSSGIKFGKQLMEKMGWSAGKGLGVNEQGMQEPLKVSFKNDTKGMGFKGNDDDWIEHQDEFNILLNQLRNNDDSSVVKGADVEKNEIKSLEEKSKQSKARVHYQKFTRGKDLSKYSENDLACILGTGKTKKKEKPKTEEVIETKTEMNGNCETSFGVTTINSGSIHDYFKKKWTADKLKQNDSANGEENFRPSFSTGKIDFSINNESCLSPYKEELKYTKRNHKSKSEKQQLDAEDNIILKSDDTNAEMVEKKKRKKTDEDSNLEEPEKKKKKKNSNDVADINDCPLKETYLSPENEDSFKEKRKKDKKQKSEVESRKKKKDKEQTHENLEENDVDSVPKSEEIKSTNNIDILLGEESVKRKKKKKKKDKKEKEEEAKENDCNKKNETLPLTENADECDLETETVKHKKKKKHRLEIFEGGNSNDASNNQDVLCNNLHSFSLEPIHAEEISDVHHDWNVEKKKKKKGKKEKINELDENGDEKSCLDVISGESNDKNEIENYLESGKKEKNENSKKKKRDGNKEIESENYGGKQIEESSLLESSCEKINSNYEENDKFVSIKKKKKKKEKSAVEKKAYLEEEKIDMESIVELESVKKKKKKHKKEKKENDNEECCQPNKSDELSVGVNSEIKKQDSEAINGDIGRSGVFSTDEQGDDRLLKLRANLFPDKAADKYFPECGTNERVLKLVRWANIAQFKGSNLSDLEGYGSRMFYNKQSR